MIAIKSMNERARGSRIAEAWVLWHTGGVQLAETKPGMRIETTPLVVSGARVFGGAVVGWWDGGRWSEKGIDPLSAARPADPAALVLI
jgi:hypothetical protein